MNILTLGFLMSTSNLVNLVGVRLLLYTNAMRRQTASDP